MEYPVNKNATTSITYEHGITLDGSCVEIEGSTIDEALKEALKEIQDILDETKLKLNETKDIEV
jgi:hypothetical protein